VIQVAMHPLSPKGVGKRIGFVFIQDTPEGLMLTPDLHELTRYGILPGLRGFHIHTNGSIDPGLKNGKVIAAGAAGPHWDPGDSKTHLGPYRCGHKGDLPALRVNPAGSAITPVVAPRLKLREVMNRALILHIGPDNYTDTPANGGGVQRAVGGIITSKCPYCKTNRQKQLLALGAAWAGLKLLS
jgi:superoxide dismutase, Cu-Zn family